jgi:hypothetical protein
MIPLLKFARPLTHLSTYIQAASSSGIQTHQHSALASPAQINSYSLSQQKNGTSVKTLISTSQDKVKRSRKQSYRCLSSRQQTQSEILYVKSAICTCEGGISKTPQKNRINQKTYLQQETPSTTKFTAHCIAPADSKFVDLATQWPHASVLQEKTLYEPVMVYWDFPAALPQPSVARVW